MQTILQKASDLYDALVVKEKKLSGQKEELAQQKHIVDAKDEANKKWHNELNAREEAVRDVENVVDLAEKNKKTLADIAAERKRINQSVAAFEEEKRAHAEEIEAQKKDLEFKKEKLRKAQEALAEKEKTYKAEVLEAVHKEQMKNAKKL